MHGARAFILGGSGSPSDAETTSSPAKRNSKGLLGANRLVPGPGAYTNGSKGCLKAYFKMAGETGTLGQTGFSLNQLESHRWESANILRGPVDAADFKTYIFPLLFFKRICDVWDEEFQEIVADTGDEQLASFPESHRFQIIEDCHWEAVRTKASNVGTALQRAMREIEKARHVLGS